jgi:hypothetical protein
VLAALCAACPARSPNGTVPPWDYSLSDIVPPQEPVSPSISVDLYVDSTVSMQGFVGFTDSELVSFIKDLEGSVRTGWKETTVHYFKFGSTVAEWPRDRFVAGVSSLPFYSEHGIAETTNIDALIAKADASHVSLVVTDLFQNEGDVNAMVDAIKRGFVVKGIPVGMLPVPSQFSGTVYDAKTPPYKYASNAADPTTYRAFYLLMFGREADLEHLVDVLGQARKVDGRLFTLLTRRPVRQHRATVPRESLSKNLVLLKVANLHPNEVHLDYNGTGDGTFLAQIEIEQHPAAPQLALDRLGVTIVRRTMPRRAGDLPGPEMPATDLMINGPLVVSGTRLTIPLRLQLPDPAGVYVYRIDLRTPSVGAFAVPRWVGDWSTDNPTPTSEPNKTINLTRFVGGLEQAASSSYQVPVARVFLQIRKK